MKKPSFTILTTVSLISALAIPLCAQTISLKGDIPFEFVVGKTTMPAGEYTVKAGGTGFHPDVLRIEATVGNAAVNVTANRLEGDKTPDQSRLVFHKYGNQYFLSRAWSNAVAGGRELRQSRTERELAKTASVRETEIVVLLAKR